MFEIVIREEGPGDAAAIREVHEEAFESDVEADLVDALRETCTERISLVALVDEMIVGHILYSPAIARAGSQVVTGVGLAPMAVRPSYQRKGVGSALVRRSMEVIRAAGYGFIIVVGHPDYYPRFGFERGSIYGLSCEFEGVPDEAFMIAVFDHDTVQTLSGVVTYHPAFTTGT